MPNYKELYFRLFRAAEDAVNTLISVQRECEELYLNAPERDMKVISINGETKKQNRDEK